MTDTRWNPKWWQKLSVADRETIDYLARQTNADRHADPKVRSRAKAT